MKTNSRVMVFPTALGWMALEVEGRYVKRLSFGHSTPQEAMADVGPGTLLDADSAKEAGEWQQLVQRLQRYAEGAFDDFLDVELAPGESTPFERRVVALCRRIPFGSSLTYGELAEKAGSRARRRPWAIACAPTRRRLSCLATVWSAPTALCAAIRPAKASA